jgi:hypothetical protein
MHLYLRYLFFFSLPTLSVFGQVPNYSISEVISLDSLIHAAPSMALRAVDYPHANLDSMRLGKKVVDKVAISSLAQQFFNDLRYGNKVPDLRYKGIKVERKDVLINQNFTSLANHLNSESPEVLQLLAVLRDSLDWPIEKKNLVTKAVNEYRWMYALRLSGPLVVVNIPSATLRMFEGAVAEAKMKVILGRASRPSKTLISPLSTLILTPHWYVPRSISVGELVPEIRKNIRYFYASHLEIFDLKGRKLAPEKVPWSRLGKNYFPYTMRQRTGKWNTLGIMKFQFANPFLMYLHDTSEKKLFQKEKRFYSHSCIRVERPLDLGRFLLKPQTKAIDTLDVAASYADHPQRYIKIKRTIPLLIWYSLVDFDAKGQVQFYPNIYQKN